MPRHSRTQIDNEILDTAAGLFAKRGFSATSLQAVADAVGYTKAGLLHHFPSKDALWQAVMQLAQRTITEHVGHLMDVPEGIERDQKLIELVVDLAMEAPGLSTLLSNMAATGAVEESALVDSTTAASFATATGIDIGVASRSPERAVAVLVASTGAKFAGLVSVEVDQRRQWRQPIIESAMRALGHHTVS